MAQMIPSDSGMATPPGGPPGMMGGRATTAPPTSASMPMGAMMQGPNNPEASPEGADEFIAVKPKLTRLAQSLPAVAPAINGLLSKLESAIVIPPNVQGSPGATAMSEPFIGGNAMAPGGGDPIAEAVQAEVLLAKLMEKRPDLSRDIQFGIAKIRDAVTGPQGQDKGPVSPQESVELPTAV